MMMADEKDSSNPSQKRPDAMVSDDTSNFFIMLRLDGKDGTRRVRIRFDRLLDSRGSLVKAAIKRYFPKDDKSVELDQYCVKLAEVSEEEWPIDIDNDTDMDLAVNTTSAKKDGYIKMSAIIRRKTDPPLTMPPSDPTPIEQTRAASDNKRKAASAATADMKSTPTKKGKITRGKLPVRARIIRSVAELRALGKDRAPRIEVALFAGYTNAASKGFSNPLSTLKSEGLVEYPDKKTVALTSKGLETEDARAVVPPKNNAEVHARIKALLTPKQQQIFDLLAADGKPRLRDEVAGVVGYTNPASKGFANSVGKLSSLELIHYPKNEADPKIKLVQLTGMCFPFAKDEAAKLHAPTRPLPPTGSASGVSV